MRQIRVHAYRQKILAVAFHLFILIAFVRPLWADVVVNILAVNGTEEEKDKDINFALPAELSVEDILDPAGLTLEYNVTEGRYYAKGKVKLQPKESKTLKLRIKDLWQYDEEQVNNIKEQIEASYKRMENTEYAETAKVKKDSLLNRLDFISGEMERSDTVEKRMDTFRTYANEFTDVRSKAVSVKYWRAKPSDLADRNVIKFVISVENTAQEKENTENKKHYLPMEVKPEHFVDLQGFQYRFDPTKGQPYLSKNEELATGEVKKYTIDIVDVWNIPQPGIDNLKDRTRNTFKLLEDSEYVDTAKYLVESIKKNLDAVEESQSVEKEIREHISAFRANEIRFNKAIQDVKALEELLDALREELERSPLRNVLQRIKQIKSLADVSEAIFGTKPTKNNAWKIITWTVIFVGLITFVHFIIWGRRSKGVKKEDIKEPGTSDGKEKKE